MSGTAIISDCKKYRYRLSREIDFYGPVYAYFGVNPSTADARLDDQTIRKWIGFTKAFGGSEFIVGNAFAYRATNVRELATVVDPVGPGNDLYLDLIISRADILVPCWGSVEKVPLHLRQRFLDVHRMLVDSGKPVKHFGLTANGSFKHPLMLSYQTPLQNWANC